MKRYINTTENVARMDLVGKVLVATPSLDDSIFEKALVYVLNYDKNGALGVIINKPLAQVQLDQVATGDKGNLPVPLKEQYVLFDGGPVENEAVLILSYTSLLDNSEFDERQPLSLFKNTQAFFRDLLIGALNTSFLIVKGYCSWGPRQLDTEMLENSWMVVDIDPESIFHGDPAKKWFDAVMKAGIKNIDDLKGMVSYSGNA